MIKRVDSKKAIQVMKGAGLLPLEAYKNVNSPWKCKCLICGGKVSPSFKSISIRKSKRKGCRLCAPNAPVLAKDALKVMKKAKLEPQVPFKNTTTKWKSKCLRCGFIVSPTYGAIKSGQSGCLRCAGMYVDPIEAITLFEKNGLSPLISYPGAGKPWLSVHNKCGRQVSPNYSNVKNGHSGCKYCVGNIIDEGRCRAFFVSRGLLPIEPYKGAQTPWKSIHQVCGKEVAPQFNSVQQGSSGCIYCSGNAPINPNAALKLFRTNGLEPIDKFTNSSTPWRSIHSKCGREVSPTYATIQQGGGGCAYCAGIKVDPVEAKIFYESLGFEPIEKYQSSMTPWSAIHLKCGRIVTPTYSSLKSSQGGCAYCSGNKVDAEEAKKLFISKGLIPQVKFPGAKKPWRSIHARCGNEVAPKYADVKSDSNGCKHCAPNFVNADEAVAIFRSADLEPLEPYPGASRGWRSRHTVCGREVTPHFGYVRRNKAGCAYCAGKLVNGDEATEFMKSKGIFPKVKYPGAQKPWLSVHNKCGKEVTPTYNALRWSRNNGCKYCADSTFNFNEPAFIYLITHNEFNAHKIGISGVDKGRLLQHSREGWLTYKIKDFETGESAHNIEQLVLSWLQKDLGLNFFLSKEEMPQGGYTETVDASEIDLPTIWAKVEALSRVKR